jgi:hypothetical protein
LFSVGILISDKRKIVYFEMDLWYEIIQAYDHQESDASDKSKKYVFSQPVAIIILIYLALGEDYPFQIAKVFGGSALTKMPRGSPLKNSNKTGQLLNKMKEDGFLNLLADEEDSKKPYKINPEIVRSPARGVPYRKADGNVFDIPIELLVRFFTWLKETYNEEERKIPFVKALEKVRVFDYITFLMFLRDRAVEWEEDTGFALESATAPRLSHLIEEYIRELKELNGIDPRVFEKIIRSLNEIIPDPRSIEIGG